MPIRIVDFPDPFTTASRLRGDRLPLIESDAYRQLFHELQRYCDGELAGRSFLIAGHRGSGKTTLVSSAFEAVLREQDYYFSNLLPDPSRPRVLRLLPVLLQGPTLLPSSKEELPYATDGTGEAGRRLTEMENVLVQITLGLHRALAREMVLAFRAHVNKVMLSAHVDRRAMLELSAQFQLELDDYTGKARLRDIWRRCGALKHGVLYAVIPGSTILDDGITGLPGSFVPRDMLPDQGLRELVGLASVCDAYRRISGKISRKDELKAGAVQKTEHSAEIDAKGKEIGGPFIAVLTGAAVGTGTLVSGADAPVAALAAVLTALAGMLAGKVSVSRTRERSASLEDLFIPDLSVATMDRILPVLLDRLRDAGLAPVFVVDELDKVEGLSDRIQDMIRRLKKMVAENACFCFLADRSYFEELRRRTASSPYSIEHTYFTHQLFIAFRHADVRNYLGEILAKPADANPGDPRMAAQIREEQADHAVLPYILMHGAQMHPIDLQRQIAQLRSADGSVILGPGLVRSKPRYQLELLLQLAIERQLEQEAMQQELDRRPAFRRLAHDAMYYISREWEKDEETLSLDDDARDTFRQYLIGRMALDKKKPTRVETPAAPARADAVDAGPPNAGSGVHVGDEEQCSSLVSLEDLHFLWSAVQTLGQALAAPASIQAEYEKPGQLSEVVVSAVREAVKLGPLFVPAEAQPHVYRWMFRRSGRRVPQQPAAVPPEAASAAPQPSWKAQVTTIREFERVLSKVTRGLVDPSTLSAGLGILPTSPAWPQVSNALSRLETLSLTKTTYPEMDDDVAVTGAYAGLLEASVRAVALSLYSGIVLANWSNAESELRLRDALEKMSHVLGLHELGPERVAAEVGRLGAEFSQLVPRSKADQDPKSAAASLQRVPNANAGVSDWIRWMETLTGGVEIPVLTSDALLEPRAEWDYWRLRMQGERPAAPGSIVVRAVTGTGSFALLKLPLETMTLRDWSLALFGAVGTPALPAWLAIVALRKLGWEGQLPKFFELWERQMLFGQGRPNGKDMRDTLGWIAPSQASRSVGRVLISSQPGAVSESWKPDAARAAVVLRPEEWSSLLTTWSPNRDSLLDAFGHDVIAVDLSAPSAPAKNTRNRKLKAEGGLPAEEPRDFVKFFDRTGRAKLSPPLLILNEEPVGTVSSRYRVIMRPGSLEELFLRANPNRAR